MSNRPALPRCVSHGCKHGEEVTQIIVITIIIFNQSSQIIINVIINITIIIFNFINITIIIFIVIIITIIIFIFIVINIMMMAKEESLARRRQTSTRVGEDEEEATGTESK